MLLVSSCFFKASDPTLMKVCKEFSLTFGESKAKHPVIYRTKSRLPHVQAQFLSR